MFSKRKVEFEVKPNLLLILEVNFDLSFHKAEIYVDCNSRHKIAVELAKLQTIDPDGDIGIKGVRVNSSINLCTISSQLY